MKYGEYSFSKIHTFFDCQKKFEFTYVNKIDIDKDYYDPIYYRKGRFLHSYIADRLKGGSGMKITGDISVDEKMDLVECADATLEHDYIALTYDFDINHIEYYIALDKNLEPCDKKIRTALKGYIDYFAIHDDFAMIVDWKTGKLRNDPDYSQLELYAIWLFQKYPQINEIDLVFFYVEHNSFIMKTITPDDVKFLKNDLMEKIELIESTDEFEINETKHCINCPFFNTCADEYGIMGLSNF